MFAEKRATVLLVDDDDTVRGFASLALEKQKFKVIQAANGEGALNAYNEHCGEVDLVITDIVMPGMFGDQLAVSLWKRNAALPMGGLGVGLGRAVSKGRDSELSKEKRSARQASATPTDSGDQ